MKTTATALSIATLSAALFAGTPATKAEAPTSAEPAPGRQISVTKEDTAFKLSSKWTVCTKDKHTVTQDTSLHVVPMDMNDAYWQNPDDLKRSYDLLDESAFNLMNRVVGRLTLTDVQALNEARKAGNPRSMDATEDEAPLVRASIFHAIMFQGNLAPVAKAITMEKDEASTPVAISSAPSPLCK